MSIKFAIVIFILNCIVSTSQLSFSSIGEKHALLRDLNINSDKSEEVECNTDSCKHWSNLLATSLRPSVDPCDDFYKFTCDFDNNSKQHLREQIQTNVKNMLIGHEQNMSSSMKRLRTLYKSCTNKNADSGQLRELVAKLGGFAMVGNQSGWQYDRFFKFEETLVKFRLLGIRIYDLFEIEISSKLERNNPMMLHVSMNGRTSSGFLSVKHLLPSMYGQGPYKYNNWNKEMEKIEELRVKINNFKDLERKRKRADDTEFEQPQLMSIDQLKMSIPGIDWRYLLENLIEQGGLLGNGHDSILLSNFEYLQNIAILIKNTDQRLLQNYVILRFIEDVRPLMGDFDRFPELDCLGLLEQHLGLDLSIEYYNHYVSNDSISLAGELIEMIKFELEQLLTDANWIKSETTRELAIAKAKSIGHSIGLDDRIVRNISQVLELFYSNLQLNDGNSLMQNVLLIEREKYSRNFERLMFRPNHEIEPIMAYDSTHNSIQMNAHYGPMTNSMTLLSGFMLPFNLDPTRSNNANYAISGMVIGHEIMHAFDSNCVRFDQCGLEQTWWDQDTKVEYEKRVECLRNQYNNIDIFPSTSSQTSSSIKSNGTRTLTENIADNFGFQLAYRAYNRWSKQHPQMPAKLEGLVYTGKQLFWIFFGKRMCANNRLFDHQDRHSIPKLRTNLPLSNTPDFAKDFNCPPGSRMNKPEDRCVIW